MAIYSLSHKPVGKSTQKDAYTAAAHINYVTRARALHHLETARMPEQAEAAAKWLRQEEDRDRANARVIDKIMLALPRELSPQQRVDLVRRFAEDISQGKASWLAAFHENAADANNPHCHLVIRDRDPETRKRVIGMSEKGSTERLRQAWEAHANAALAAAEQEARIDRRTLEAQGLTRQPTLHEGVRGRRIVAHGRTPSSRRRWYRNGIGAKRRTREVDYPALDRGESRSATNASRRRDAERAHWAEIDAENERQELEKLRMIHHPPVQIPEYQRFREAFQRHKAQTKLRAGPQLDLDQEWEPDI